MNEVKALLFDVGGVLLTIDYEILAREALRLIDGPAPSAADFEKAELKARPELDRILTRQTSESTDTRRYYLSYTWKHAFSFAGLEAPSREITEEWARAIEKIHHEINLWRRLPDGNVEALQAIKDLGYKMAVVSNADGRVEKLLEEKGLRQFFSFVLDSHIEGVEKPSPVIFQRAVKRFELQASECMYLGDFYSVDVVGARKAGLKAVLMDPGNFWTEKKDVKKVQSLSGYLQFLKS